MRAITTVATLALVTIGCGESVVDPGDSPVITVSGVTDGETRARPVTVTITVEKGAYSATLNGRPFLSGMTVRQAGDHLLVVTARLGEITSTASVAFTITLSGETRLIIRLLDLGENESGGGGDAILLTDSSSAGQRHALVDAGPAGVGGSDVTLVRRALDALGVDTLVAMVLSHAHSDHFGGVAPVLQTRVVERFYANGQVRNYSAYNALITEAQLRADTYVEPSVVTEVELGFGTDATALAIIPPLMTFLANANADASEINEGSIGTEVVKGSFRMFLTGDGEVLANQRWRSGYGTRSGPVTALKVGHHGANDAVFDDGFSGSSAWLTHTAPELAVITANGTTHPRINATTALLNVPGLTVYCTHVHGDVTIRVGDQGTFTVTVEKNGGQSCTPGRDATT
jgi:beta-lactamase superfamily II metal-dependent hydrolase